jgi:membrane protein DedA with SNARE-associated domain
MDSSVEWFSSLLVGYPLLQYLIILLGVVFTGELALFAIGFLGAQGVLPLFLLVSISFIGVLLADTLWFLLGRTPTAEKITSHRYAYATTSTILQALDRISRGNHFLAIVLAKFIIGTRIIMVIYLSKTNLELRKFVLYDLVAISLWFAVVVTTGYASGLGFAYISGILQNAYAGAGFIILIVLIIIIIQIWIKRTFVKKEKDILEEKNL